MSIIIDTPRLLDTTALVRVRAAANPFGLDTVDLNVPEGLTLAQIFEIAQPDPVLRASAHVFINSHYIERENWHRVKPKAGENIVVTIRAFIPPKGGERGSGAGKNILRAILVIGVLAASLFLGPALGALIAPAGFLGMTSVGVGKAIIGMVGMLLVNALVPVKSGQSDTQQDSQTLFVEGARNRANPFGPVPVLFGRHKMVPLLAARPYTETVGDNQYLRMVFTWGIGPISIDTDTLKIGETLLTEFDDYEIEHREGYSDDDPLTLYPGVVDQEQLSIVLSEPDGFTLRTSSDDADELSVDLTFFNGFVKYNDKNKQLETTVQVEIQYSLTGAGSWQSIPVTGGVRTFPDSWINNLSGGAFSLMTFRGKKAAAIRHGITWKTPTRGQYDIRIRRVTEDHDPEDDKITDELTWSAIRRITNESPINSPVPIALTAIRIKATDQLNGVIDEFSGIVTRVANDWDSGTETWIEREARNPAAAFRFVLQGHGLQKTYLDSKIDLESLAEWSEFCDANGFSYDYIQDAAGSSLWDKLVAIAAAGRATPKRRNGKIGVIIDKPSLPVSFITPRNSSGFTVSKPFIVDRPHFFRVRFPNEEQDYRQDEQRVYINGYTAETGTLSETMSFEGVTNPDAITRHARFAAAVAVHQAERWTFSQDMEYLAYSRGDVVTITHDVLVVGKASGRIKSLTVDGSNNVTSITVDEDFVIEAGDDYGVVIRTTDDAAVTAQLSNPAGTYRTVVFTTPIPPASGVGVGNLVGFGIFGLESDEARVLAIEPESELRARITCVPYREIVYTIDGEVIPPFNTKIVPIDNVGAPVVSNVYSIGPGTYMVPRVGIAVVPSAVRSDLILEVQIQPDETAEPYSAATIFERGDNGVTISNVQIGDVINIRVRWRGPGIVPTAWTYVLGFEVELVEPFATLPDEVVTVDNLNAEIYSRIQQIVSQIPNDLQWLRDELANVGHSIAEIFATNDELMAQIRIGAGAQYLENAAGIELNATATAGINSALAQLFVGLFAINDDGTASNVGVRMTAAALPTGALAAVDLEVSAGDGVNWAAAALHLVAYYSADLGYYSEALLEGDQVKLVVHGVTLPAGLLAVQDASYLTPIISNHVKVDLTQRREVYETLLTGNITYDFPTIGDFNGLFRWEHIFRQDATGGRTVTFASEYRNTPTITLSANTMTKVAFRIVGYDPDMVVYDGVTTISLSGGDLPIDRVFEYSVPGTYKLVLPVHNTIKFEAVGPGGAGGNAGIGSTSRSGSGAAATTITFPANSLVAGGTAATISAGAGQGGDGVRASSNPPAKGVGAAASGGDTNTTGVDGENGIDSGSVTSTTGKGGNAPGPFGGAGGARPSAGDLNGRSGAWPGGGGSGAWNTFGGDTIGGGGASGAYAMRDENAGVIKSGIEITIVIPAGGSPASSGKRTGGRGAAGGARVTIT